MTDFYAGIFLDRERNLCNHGKDLDFTSRKEYYWR